MPGPPPPPMTFELTVMYAVNRLKRCLCRWVSQAFDFSDDLGSNGVVFQVMRTPKNEVVDRALQLCGQLGSFADGCKLEVLDNFEDIYQALTHLTPVCHLSGVCSDAYANTPTTLTR